MRRDPVGPGQESVWDYPRPPSADVTGRHIVVEVDGRVVADTLRAVRVCETSHPPVYYVPHEDIADGVLERAGGGSWCEWKGAATYWDLVVGKRRVPQAAWSYEHPSPGFEHLTGAVAFLSGKGRLGARRRRAGPCAGRWLLRRLDHRRGRGPVQGEPGTLGW